MIEEIYQIDPDADTVIILRNANAEFAPWISTTTKDAAIVLDQVSRPAIEEPAIEEPAIEESAIEENAVEEPVVDENVVEESTDHAGPSIESVSETERLDYCSVEREIHFHVSSRHLILASPKFKSMLSGEKWKEGVRDDNDGLYHIQTEEWDTEALLLLLRVIHHRNRQVPRSIPLEMLAKIAVLIDYYQCAEALELHTEGWIGYLKVFSPIPSHFCRDAILWMCIAWVFRLGHEFAQTTTVALRRHDQDLPTLGLPIIVCVGGLANSAFVDY
ncbi:hypothetical protein N0V90_010067 [Kalmusia sp. IMI 367209]|nr:hypothetical protein N0V90_010067 [Kalmusia sp. IMI 367209]